MTIAAPTAPLSVTLAQTKPIPLAVSLRCNPGELVALVGPSGSGKTSVLRAIAGLLTPEKGRIASGNDIWFSDEDAINLPAQSRLTGMVFQDYALFPHLTALQNVTIALGDPSSGETAKIARLLLDQVNLHGLEDRRPETLSGGQRQRVALARALARRPRALLLDEPFSAVDQMTRVRLKRELLSLRRSLNCPIIMVTHDIEEALALADQMVVLHHGEVLQVAAPEDVRLHPSRIMVARLMGQTNIFSGVLEREAEPGRPGILSWAGTDITATDTGAYKQGQAVSWMVASDHVVVYQPEVNGAERPNTIHGHIVDVAHLGENSAMTMAIEERHGGNGEVLKFQIRTRNARQYGLSVDADAVVSLLPEGIHLMPREE